MVLFPEIGKVPFAGETLTAWALWVKTNKPKTKAKDVINIFLMADINITI